MVEVVSNIDLILDCETTLQTKPFKALPIYLRNEHGKTALSF